MKTHKKDIPVLDRDYDIGDNYLTDLVRRISADQSDYVQRAFSDWLN